MAHPTPPPAFPRAINVGREYSPTSQELSIVDEHIRLFNIQCSPITINSKRW